MSGGINAEKTVSADQQQQRDETSATASRKPIIWNEWQKHWHQQTLRWWPVFFKEYNISLSGQYITLLPAIVLQKTLSSSSSSSAEEEDRDISESREGGSNSSSSIHGQMFPTKKTPANKTSMDDHRKLKYVLF
jgi:hypothetical protein